MFFVASAFIHNKQKRQRVAACTSIYIDSLGVRCRFYVFYSGAFRRLFFFFSSFRVAEAKKSFDFFFYFRILFSVLSLPENGK